MWPGHNTDLVEPRVDGFGEGALNGDVALMAFGVVAEFLTTNFNKVGAIDESPGLDRSGGDGGEPDDGFEGGGRWILRLVGSCVERCGGIFFQCFVALGSDVGNEFVEVEAGA